MKSHVLIKSDFLSFNTAFGAFSDIDCFQEVGLYFDSHFKKKKKKEKLSKRKIKEQHEVITYFYDWCIVILAETRAM